jgi:hypothetical protein
MAEEWDSSPVWGDARERTRAEVRAAFAPRPQTCPSCRRTEATQARNCLHCGASYVFVQPKMSKRAKLAIAGAVLALVAAGSVAWLLVSPSIHHAKQAATARDAAQKAAFIRSETRRLKADQRLHHGRGISSDERRSALVNDLQAAITTDALGRVKAGTLTGPIRGTTCEPVKLGPLVPNSSRGGYQCVAINEHIVKGSELAGLLGYPFWAVVDYRHRAFVWCKVNPKPGEMAVRTLEPVVNPPAACDLHI